MAHHLFDFLRGYLAHYGYWTVAVALLLENAGLPVPGETILLLASFAAFSEHRLHLPYVILVGICAATIGDNIGFAIGHSGGRALMTRYSRFFRVRYQTVARGEEIFRHYGAATIFFARFVAGLRVIAGPLAGALRMPWRKFAIFNFLGAALWVTVVSCAGYFFGRHWDKLVAFVRTANIALLIAAIAIIAFFWWRRRKVPGR